MALQIANRGAVLLDDLLRLPRPVPQRLRVAPTRTAKVRGLPLLFKDNDFSETDIAIAAL